MSLRGVRVLDLTHYVAGPFCTKLLADYGADVLKIERPPDGDPARRVGPFFRDVPHPEGSALFLHLNTNKRSATINLKTAEGHAIFTALARRADVVVESFRPGTLERLGFGYRALQEINPRLIVTSISNFGQDGPYRDYRLSDLTANAMGGPMNATGHQSREPLKAGRHVAFYHAGAVAALATLMALYRAEVDGRGDHIDVAIYETLMGSRDRRAVHLTAYAYTGEVSKRQGVTYRLANGVRPTRDGYIHIAGGGPRLPRLLRMIGREDLLSDPRFSQVGTGDAPDLDEEIERGLLAWSLQRTKQEALADLQAYRLVGGAINGVADLFADPHFKVRRPWDVVEHPHTGTLTYPGRPFKMSRTRRRDGGRAPLLGEHTATVLCDELGYQRGDLPRLREQGVI